MASQEHEVAHQTDQAPRPYGNSRGPTRIPFVIGCCVVFVLLTGGVLLWRAEAQTNRVALADSARPVTYVEAQATQYRPKRTYVGTLEPWVEANVGPQLTSAYVDTVLVRPGATVRRGEVLATLDCRNASATSQAVAMQARAIDARQQALTHESARIQDMLTGGFVSPNEAERIAAQSVSEQAELEATKAKLASTSLGVDDCILRAPFNGEVATRNVDPGAFVRPGTAIVSVIDRNVVRVSADAPENDFDVIKPGTTVRIHAYATAQDFTGTITRRAPSAHADSRTVHFEIDVDDPKREIPVGTTGEVSIDVGEPTSATSIPLYAATIRNGKASVFLIEQDVGHLHTYRVIGEGSGILYVDPALPASAHVVTEGRALLEEGDHVVGKPSSDTPSLGREDQPGGEKQPQPPAQGLHGATPPATTARSSERNPSPVQVTP